MNIQFNYLYRDAGNYKNYGSVIFHNPNNLPVGIITAQFERCLIDGTYFYAESMAVPNLFFPDTDDDDVSWHEFESFETTSLQPSRVDMTIDDFLKHGEKHGK